METKAEEGVVATGDRPRRVIKRYSNRKLYDTKDSRYVTLLQIAELVRSGDEVQIIDNNTKEDLTEITLAQIIYEEQKQHSKSVPLQTLKDLIHSRTEKVLEGLREGPIGKLIPGGRDDKKTDDASPATEPPAEATKPEPRQSELPPKPTLVDQAKEKFEDIQHHIDARIHSLFGSIRPLEQLQAEVKRLSERIEDLEARLKGQGPDKN